jgi:hypothetical protein
MELPSRRRCEGREGVKDVKTTTVPAVKTLSKFQYAESSWRRRWRT